jgi:hypothetical protein
VPKVLLGLGSIGAHARDHERVVNGSVPGIVVCCWLD